MPFPQLERDISTIYYYLLHQAALDNPLASEHRSLIETYLAEFYPLSTLTQNMSELHISESAMVLTIYAHIASEAVPDSLLRQFDDLMATRWQSGELGLDDVHSVLVALEAHGYTTRLAAQLPAWILDCFHPDGGVAYYPLQEDHTPPSLFFTGLALDSLALLGQDTDIHAITKLVDLP